MTMKHQASKNDIESILVQMISEGIVHPDAKFNYNAEFGLRKEVSYRDDDFLYKLERLNDEKIIDDIIDFLKRENIVQKNADYNKEIFIQFRKEIKAKFIGSWTSFTPAMERFVYMLVSLKQPEKSIEFGCFWGNTLAWFAGPGIGKNKIYESKIVYGIDRNTEMIKKAKENFSKISNSNHIQIIEQDVLIAADQLEGPFDMIYLEAKNPEQPELYLQILKEIYDKLPKGAWVIAHDTTSKHMQNDFVEYLKWVRNKDNFSESISFDIDSYGMELSIK